MKTLVTSLITTLVIACGVMPSNSWARQQIEPIRPFDSSSPFGFQMTVPTVPNGVDRRYMAVEIADHTALNEREVRAQQRKRIKESQSPDENRLFVKGTDTQGEAKILCGGVCKGIFAKGEMVRLEASLKVGQRHFYRWSDNRCSNGLFGKGRICEIKVNGDVTVQAYYR